MIEAVFSMMMIMMMMMMMMMMYSSVILYNHVSSKYYVLGNTCLHFVMYHVLNRLIEIRDTAMP